MAYQPNQPFISKYAEKFAESCSNELFKSQQFIDGKELTHATEIKQLNLFLVKFIFENWQAEIAQLYSPYFNYNAPDVKQALNQLMGLLSKNIRIAREDFEPMLKQSVEDLLVYLVNPAVYFDAFLMEHDGQWHIQKQLMPLANYFSIHANLAKNVFGSFKEARRDALEPKQACELAKEHTGEYEVNLSENEDVVNRLAAIHPLYIDDVIEGNAEGDPVHVLEETSFDLHKHIAEPSDTEENTASDQDAEQFDYKYEDFESREKQEKRKEELAALQNMLDQEEDSKLESEEPSPSPLTADAEALVEKQQDENANGIEQQAEVAPESIEEEKQEEQQIVDVEEDEEVKEESAIDLEQSPEPVGTFEDSLNKDSFEETPQEVEKATLPSPENDEPSVLEKLAKTQTEEPDSVEEEKEEDSGQYKALLERLGKKKVSSLRDSIALNQKFKFQNELFKGDNAALNDAIDAIDQCGEYKEAMTLIRSQYVSKYEWDFSDETTIEFLNLVNEKY